MEELPTHGGSLRIYAAHARRALPDSAGVRAVRAEEERAGLAELDTYRQFCRSASLRAGTSLLGFLAHAKSQGKRVAAYGAAAKGNTLLNFCGVTAAGHCAGRGPQSAQAVKAPARHATFPVVSPEELHPAPSRTTY